MKVFDYEKAARLIREHQSEYATAYLAEDGGETYGVIYKDGKAVLDSDAFLRSTWATPVIIIDFEVIECWKKVEGNDYPIDWTPEALAILEAPYTIEEIETFKNQKDKKREEERISRLTSQIESLKRLAEDNLGDTELQEQIQKMLFVLNSRL